MKNLLLLAMLFLISSAGYLHAQCPSEVNVSSNSNCLLIKWNPDINKKPQNILVIVGTDTIQYFQDGQPEGYWRYFIQGPGGPSGCDTVGMTPFVGTIKYQLSGGNYTCEYLGGEYKPECPDEVLVSATENCLLFLKDTTFAGSLPETIRLNMDTFYLIAYDYMHPNPRLYLKDTSMQCDTTTMSPMTLNDTLFIGPAVCTYANGLLPITILAFDYQNSEGQVSLSWEVNSEEPTRQLFLQKSYNGVDWMNVYEQNLQNYTAGVTMDGKYTDHSILQPRLYYRLFITGYNEVTYSRVLPVTLDRQVVNTLFYQSQSRSIMIKAGQNYAGQMYLTNVHGQNVLTKEVNLQKNTYQEIHVRGHLPAGIYFVRFDSGLIPPTRIFIDR